MDYKAEAEKIVEMFMPYTGTGDAYNFRATQCAIKHVEGMISQLVYNDYLCSVNRDKWNEILNQLKQM